MDKMRELMALRSRAPLAVILAATLLASCGARPGLTTSVNGQPVQMVLASTTERTGCSATHGDAFPQNVPVTTVRGSGPVTLRFEAGGAASRIRIWLYDLDAPAAGGGPTEEVVLPGRSGTYELGSVPGRTYQILANVEWSALIASGEETHMFRLRLESP